MPRLFGSGLPAPDIGELKRAGDIPSLVRLLGSADPQVQWHAAEALGTCGEHAVPLLIQSLKSHSIPVRLGAIEALGMIRDERAASPLIAVTGHDRSPDVRYAAVLALGEIRSPDVIPSIVPFLRDPNRYLRYGAAVSLKRLGWQPENQADRAGLLIAEQDWESVRILGPAAVPYLVPIFNDTDPATREMIVSVLGQIGDREAQALCQAALRDRNPSVRWKAVLASMNCGLASHNLPLMVAARERTGPNPAAAALLNFLFFGIGYNYLGKWWGFPVFMTYMSVLVLAQFAMGPFVPYLITYPLTAVAGIHTYYLARRMSDF
ncbi:MAG: HEAT repeat domain-containing protein [Methanoregula sp.]|nr:HEAT repeat domain-containing protein [Methanoregula sp.]